MKRTEFVVLLMAASALAAAALAPASEAQPIQPAGRAGDTSQLEADFTILGDYPGAYTGASIAVGDVNGDGIHDLVYGVPLAQPASMTAAGEVHVFFGMRTRPGHELKQLKSPSCLPDLVVSGENPGDRLGTSVAVGDVNGDGIDDLILGAGTYTQPARSATGSVFVLFGRKDWPSSRALRAERADIQVIGAHYTDRLGGHRTQVPATYTGQSVAAGDLNGDGIDDLILGAPDATYTVNELSRSRGGAVYVLWGRGNWPAAHKHDLLATPADLTFYAAHSNAYLGACFAVGDFNGDGVADLALGAPGGNAPGRSGVGLTSLIWGRQNWPAGAVVDFGADGKADLAVLGERPWDQSGSSVALGDLDGDRLADLVIGAWQHAPANQARILGGKVYVLKGKSHLPPAAVVDLSVALADLSFLGASTGDWLGYRVRTADLDGDGLEDLALSAPGASPGFRARAGITYLFRGGRATPPYSTLDLQTAAVDWRIWGGVAHEYLGQALGVGDVNGDGVADLLQAGDLTNFDGLTTYAGRLVVTYGGPLFANARARIGNTLSLTVLSPANPREVFVAAASFGLAANRGIALGSGRVIPIDVDVLTVLCLLNSPPFTGFVGQLDGVGVSTTPTTALPAVSGLVGVTLFSSMVIQKPSAPQGIQLIGNRVHTTILP
ncbi:MAG: FG-GAP repeat protein [Planctomycetes bacterium]|nr:FG-GAP repeat protein [Planctomycetota bacterium]